MTTITNSDDNELKQLLIKNLPAKIKAGTTKYNSNIREYPSHIAIDKFKFINFNSKEKVSLIIFDIDEYENRTALDYFKSIDNFLDYIMETIGLEPTYILTTNKGFHFGYHLKNWVFTNQTKALSYLIVIKESITKLLQCDKNASHRLYGVYRNPILHQYYYSYQINYELDDFKFLLPKREFIKSDKKIRKCNIKVDTEDLKIGNRNNALFFTGMRYAKDKENLSLNDIYNYLNNINLTCEVPLENKEILTISKSVFNYWKKNKIDEKFGTIETKINMNINNGVMDFKKMSGLSFSEYKIETKKRQQLSATRTIEIRDKDKNKEQLVKVRQEYINKKNIENEKKVLDAVKFFKDNNMKINISRIAKYCKLSWKTVNKLILNYSIGPKMVQEKI